MTLDLQLAEVVDGSHRNTRVEKLQQYIQIMINTGSVSRVKIASPGDYLETIIFFSLDVGNQPTQKID